MLSGHYWELILYCPKILINSIINISNRNELSSPQMINLLYQLLVKTSKVWDLQVFSKLVESNFWSKKMNKYSLLKQNRYDLNNFKKSIYPITSVNTVLFKSKNQSLGLKKSVILTCRWGPKIILFLNPILIKR